jgi:AAHS family benzoate transporter-like MFS transporter
MRQVDVKETMSQGKFNGFVILTIVLCATLTIFDGYTQAIMGTCLTDIKADLNVNSVIAGYLSSASIFGVLFGAISCGILSDKIGRKKVMILSLSLFAVFTSLTALAHSAVPFMITLFLAGLGLGGIYPAAFATATEYAPAGKKALTVVLVGAGMEIGKILAAMLTMWLLPAFGWRIIFILGVLPLAVIPPILKFIPETIPIYIRNRDFANIKRVLHKLNPKYVPCHDDEFIYEISNVKSGSFIELFRNGRARNTICFILLYGSVVGISYALLTWLPAMMVNAGYSLKSGLTSQLLLDVGVLTGSLVGSLFADQFGFKRVLMFIYACGAVATFAMSGISGFVFTMIMLMIVGACTAGAQNLNQGYVSSSYPVELRGTMLGWSLGLARIPGMLAPIVLGYFVQANLPLSTTFIILSFLPLVAFAVVGLSKDVSKNH